MSEETNGVAPSSKKKWSKKPDAKHRRKQALERLRVQYKSGFKPTKDGGTENLSPKDVSRIEKEMAILETRI